MTALRHILAILVLPGTVTIVVPTILLWRQPPTPWPLSGMLQWLATGVGLGALALGLGLFWYTVRQFATVGRGTLAPWDPPRHLVVRGVYRHVRNPMITGVLLVLLGESLVFASTRLLWWLLCFFLVNAVYIPLDEERRLERRFGEEYRLYRTNVPRWIPRFRPWEPPWDSAEGE